MEQKLKIKAIHEKLMKDMSDVHYYKNLNEKFFLFLDMLDLYQNKKVDENTRSYLFKNYSRRHQLSTIIGISVNRLPIDYFNKSFPRDKGDQQEFRR